MKGRLISIFLVVAALLIAPSLQYSDPTSKHANFGGLSGYKPGLKLRMTQAVSDLVKENLLTYGVSYMNWDMHMAESGVEPIASFPIYTDVHYSNLKYDPFILDIDNAFLNFTHMLIDDKAVIYTELPALKHWNVAFEYYFKMLFTFAGNMDIAFKDAEAICTTELRATEDGHLFLHLHDLKIDIKHTTLYVKGAFS